MIVFALVMMFVPISDSSDTLLSHNNLKNKYFYSNLLEEQVCTHYEDIAISVLLELLA